MTTIVLQTITKLNFNNIIKRAIQFNTIISIMIANCDVKMSIQLFNAAGALFIIIKHQISKKIYIIFKCNNAIPIVNKWCIHFAYRKKAAWAI